MKASIILHRYAFWCRESSYEKHPKSVCLFRPCPSCNRSVKRHIWQHTFYSKKREKQSYSLYFITAPRHKYPQSVFGAKKKIILRGHKTFFHIQLSWAWNFIINKMPTSRKHFMLSSAVHEESLNCWYLIFYRQNKFHSQLSWAWKKGFITSGPYFSSSIQCHFYNYERRLYLALICNRQDG